MRVSSILKSAILLIGCMSYGLLVPAQDTFSICAVDPVTGEVGSAGASCIAGCVIISDVHPGVGVVHTQSYYLSGNQAYARGLMDSGHSPSDIIDSLVVNDVGGDSTIRQYGIVDLVGGGRSASFTGSGCLSYASQRNGPAYAIQGNILLGPGILDSMENRFLTTSGTLAERLMASLQGANVVGADTRCATSNRSSISAFIRVARPGDTTGVYYLDLTSHSSAPGQEPIDTLQSYFNEWLLTGKEETVLETSGLSVYPNPTSDQVVFEFADRQATSFTIILIDETGKRILVDTVKDGRHEVDVSHLASGLYFYQVFDANGSLITGKLKVE